MVTDLGCTTVGRKPFRRRDISSNTTIRRCDISLNTTIRRLRQSVEISSKNVEISSTIKSKNDTNKQFYIRLYSEFYEYPNRFPTHFCIRRLMVASLGVLKLSIYQPAGRFLRSPCDFLQTGHRFLDFHFLLARDMHIMHSFTYRNVVHCRYSTSTISIFTTPVYFNCRLSTRLSVHRVLKSFQVHLSSTPVTLKEHWYIHFAFFYASKITRNDLWNDLKHLFQIIIVICTYLHFKGLSQYNSPGRVAQSVGHLTSKSGVLGSIPGLATYFRFSFRFSRRAVVSYWRKHVHEVLVNRLGGLSLSRKSVLGKLTVPT